MAAVAVIGRDVFLHMYTLVGCGRCRSGDWPPQRISYICNRWLAAVAVIGRSVSHTYVYTGWLPSVRAAAARSRGDHWIRALQMNICIAPKFTTCGSWPAERTGTYIFNYSLCHNKIFGSPAGLLREFARRCFGSFGDRAPLRSRPGHSIFSKNRIDILKFICSTD